MYVGGSPPRIVSAVIEFAFGDLARAPNEGREAYRTPITGSRITVATTDISRDPRQPMRLEKKKNIVQGSTAGPDPATRTTSNQDKKALSRPL